MSDASVGYSAATRLRTGTRDDVRAALVAQRARTLALAQRYVDALGPDLAVPYDPGLNPPRWELGHVAWFQDWWIARNRQRPLGVRCDPLHPRPPATLAGADDWFDSSRIAHRPRWSLPLPPLGGLRQWMDETFAATLGLLDALPPDAGDDDLYFFRLVCLHEAMHAEAACYMARRLGFAVPLPPRPVGPPSALQVPAQAFDLGWQGAGFAFDNELQPRTVALAAFEIDAVPVTWARYAAFVDAGGYQQRDWWTADGWQWRQRERQHPPRLPRGHDAAVHLSCHEAEAWCRWAGRRLPSEAEWECAALTAPGFAWGQAWEWTASTFQGWPGFVAHPYRDYSQPWFGRPRVLRGACAATSEVLAHPRYRNFFDPWRSDIFAGFRSCALPAPAVAV
ncbi:MULTISPECIES: selenoneine synthase SenA [Ramlibacter]|uniref:Ergothioneine biosynthesis protein EgtB n=1 Tax=Ramlibacter pinisoli TaxID=2682844 RepID=A0A6N8IT02_9BURK|nr:MULTISPECIES: selenoneine synthase SenA [Ramlibacter]MBA2965076.1 ergothioneine biosynthesis protein EgtB [Ramlibacter sp. CGMCC 1.13660]MVQ30041.1 ergothioneine biosynthesis protein EgtB [Ramlibacter pinisoli]